MSAASGGFSALLVVGCSSFRVPRNGVHDVFFRNLVAGQLADFRAVAQHNHALRIARDFFHVFWSRYYEWSPGVARIAAGDPAVAEHIRWGFLDPWLAWLEFATIVGQRSVADLSGDERRDVLERLGARLQSWLAELPNLMEGKCPTDASEVFAAFERFRTSAGKVFSA